MRLIVGLGNPGATYAQTRHNIGWLVVDALAERSGANWRSGEQSLVAEVRLGSPPGEKVLLVKPQTFMNSSGQAVWPLMSFYKLTGDELLVVQDDLDSPFGLLRLRMGGRHGGQNGVRDIIGKLGYDRFARLKLGISRPPAGRDPADWVLSKWHPDEQATLSELVRLGVRAAECWATRGLTEAQGQFNSTDLRPRPEPAVDDAKPESTLATTPTEPVQPD